MEENYFFEINKLTFFLNVTPSEKKRGTDNNAPVPVSFSRNSSWRR